MCLCLFPCMFPGMLSVFVCFVCILYVYIHIYIYIYIYMDLYVYLYVCVYICIFICASLYVCARTHFCLYKSYLFNCLSCRYLGCYLSVWHCYLGNILAFSFEIVKLNTTTDTKSSTKVMKINLGSMNSLFPTIIVNNSGRMYLFIWINSNWFTDWLIDWLIEIRKVSYYYLLFLDSEVHQYHSI